jgi:EAL domain-containing protein (putative c-di-GMP-specific phosphodiesterase class I)
VETETQATLLRAAGCEVVQGFFFGKPQPLVLDGNRLREIEPERRVANLN